jgi:predicted MFS family arabinose efflux permease
MPIGVVLFLLLFAIGIDNYIVVAILPQIAANLAVTVAVVGLLASAYALPNAILAPVFGPLSDRYGRKVVMLGGMGLFLAAVAASALAPSFELLLAARLVNGLAAAIVLPAAFAYVSDHTTEAERGRAIATLFTAYPASTLLGLPAGGFAAAIAGWQAAFWVVLIIAVVPTLLVARMPSDRGRPEGQPGYLESLRSVAGNGRAIAVLAVTLVWFTAALGMFAYIGEFMHRSFGLSSAEIGLVLTLIGVVGIAATRLGARYIRVIGARRCVLLGIACFTTAAFLLPWTTGALPVALATFALWIFGTWFGLPAQQTIVSNLIPASRGTTLAFNSSAVYLGGVIGPALAGSVLAAGGFVLLGTTAGGIAAGALVLAALSLPSDRREPASEAATAA